MGNALRLLASLLVGATVFWLTSGQTERADVDNGPVLNSIRVERMTRVLQPDDFGIPVRLHRRLSLHGRGFRRAGAGPTVRFRFGDGRDVVSPLVAWESDQLVYAWVPDTCDGTAVVILENPDGRYTMRPADL